MEDNQDSSWNKRITQTNTINKLKTYIDQIQENNKEIEVNSTEQIFNMKSYRQNDEEYQKEFISNNASSIAETKPINQDKKMNFSQKIEDSDAIQVDKLIGKDTQRFSLLPSSSHQGNQDSEKRTTITPFLILGQDSQIKYKESTDDERFQSSTRKKTHTQIQNNKAFLNLQLIAQIKKKIMYFYKNFTSVGRKTYLSNPVVRNTINDNSDVIQLDKNVFFIFRILHDVKYRLKRVDLHVDQYIKLFSPHSLTSYILLRLFAMYNSLFYLIFSIMIIFHGPYWFQSVWYPITLVVWLFEAAYHMNTQIYIKNQIVSDRFHIIANYVKIRALYDFISFITMIILPSAESSRNIFYIISFIKLVNTMKDINEIQKDLIMQVQNYYMVSLVNLILRIFVIGHVVACMWYLVGQIEVNYFGEPETWYDGGLPVEKHWWIIYLEAMYWSLTLLTTGSNIATTVFQMFFTTFVMIFTTIIFGYLLNVTGVIISSLDEQNECMRKDLNIVNYYMRNNKISKKLQAQINSDIENYYGSNMNRQLDNKQQILQKISPTLLNQLRGEYCNQILDKFPIFRKKFSKDTLELLSHELEEIFYLPNQQIFEEGQPSESALMYIAQGSVELTQSFLGDTKTQKTILKLKKGQIFGAVNFFSGLAPDKSAKSGEFTKIVKIDRQNFINIVKDDEKDYQVFCEIRDKILNYESFEVIDQKCLFCQNSTHLEAECHLIHIQKDEIYQKLKFFARAIQDRDTYTRKQSYLKTYTTCEKVKNEVEYFRETRKEEIENLDYLNTKPINTDADNISSDYDEEDDNMYRSGEPTDNNSQTEIQTTPKNKKEYTHELHLNIDTKIHNKSYDISETSDKKIRKQSSMLSPDITFKHHHGILYNQHNHLQEEVMLDSAQQDRHGRKTQKTFSIILQDKQQQEKQKRGSGFSKQSTMNNRSNFVRDEIGVINLNENDEEDDQVDPLPQTSIRKKNSKMPIITKCESQKKRNSIFSKYKFQEEQIERQYINSSQAAMSNSIYNGSHINKHFAVQLNKVTSGGTSQYTDQQNQYKQFEALKQFQEEYQIIQSYLEWDFDKAAEWKYYFTKGNSKVIFQRYQKYQRKKLKQSTTKKSKNVQPVKKNSID